MNLVAPAIGIAVICLCVALLILGGIVIWHRRRSRF